jgi:hypothetical protein
MTINSTSSPRTQSSLRPASIVRAALVSRLRVVRDGYTGEALYADGSVIDKLPYVGAERLMPHEMEVFQSPADSISNRSWAMHLALAIAHKQAISRMQKAFTFYAQHASDGFKLARLQESLRRAARAQSFARISLSVVGA